MRRTNGDALDEASRSVATRFAQYAAVVAGNLYAYQAARDLADDLQAALESRAVIDRAKGILIERHRHSPDQAFQLLARASMATNRKVREIADHLVPTGEMPPGPSGTSGPSAEVAGRSGRSRPGPGDDAAR